MNTNNFSNNLRALRLAKGYTQQEISEILNILRQTYCNYENGQRIPSLDFIIKISDFFQIPLDSLIRGTIVCTEDRTLIFSEINQDSAKLLLDYLSLSPKDQKEIRNLINYKLRNTSI